MSRMCTHLNLQQPVLYAYGLFFFVHFSLIFGILISGGNKIEEKKKSSFPSGHSQRKPAAIQERRSCIFAKYIHCRGLRKWN